MLTVSPQPCSLGWILDDPPMAMMNYDTIINSFSRVEETSAESIHQLNNAESASDFHDQFFNGPTKTTKKLNHNASERDRRKKINTLYADLRDLLPQDDHSRKLSIPATISRVLKYIPELQKEVGRLIQNKERLISKAQDDSSSIKFKKIKPIKCSAVSATRISDEEIIIQTSMPKSEKKGSLISEAILRLEGEGFLIMNVSCFETFEGRLFCNFHLQAQEGGQVIDAEKLKEKVWASI